MLPRNRDSRRQDFLWLHAGTSIGLSIVPIIVLLTSQANPDVQRVFRAQPTNLSYELMTFAVGLSMMIASGYATHILTHNEEVLLSALDSIRILWPLTHSMINFIIGCYATGILWLLLGAIPSAISAIII